MTKKNTKNSSEKRQRTIEEELQWRLERGRELDAAFAEIEREALRQQLLWHESSEGYEQIHSDENDDSHD